MHIILHQYQQVAKPLEPSLTTPLTITSWWAQASEPVRTVTPLVAEGRFVRPLEVSFVTEPASQSWFRRASEPVRQKPQLVPEPRWCGVLEPTFYVNPTPLIQAIQQPFFAKPPLRTGPWFVQPLEPRVILPAPPLSWFQPAGEPRRDRPQLVSVGAYTRPLEPIIVGLPPALSWHQPASEPLRARAPLPAHPSHAQPPFIEVRSDTWHRQQSEPPRLPPRHPAGGGAETLPPDTLLVVTIDQWGPRAFPVGDREPPRPEGGLAAPPAFNAMPVYSWLQPPSEPQRQPGRMPPTLAALVELREAPTPAATIAPVPQVQGAAPRLTPSPALSFVREPDNLTLDKWARQPSDPLPGLKRAVEGATIAPPAFVTFDVLAWIQPLSQPLRTAPRPTAAEIVVSLVVTRLPEDWFQPQSAPVWLRRQTPAGGGVRVEFEDATVHAWRSSEQPLARPPAAFPRGCLLAITEQSLLATPGLDSWYRPASEPVRRHAPLPLAFGVLVFERATPASYGFVQKAQIFG